MKRSIATALLTLVILAICHSPTFAQGPVNHVEIVPDGTVVRFLVFPNGFRTPPQPIDRAVLQPQPGGLSRLVYPGAMPLVVPANFVRFINQPNGAVLDNWFLPANPATPYAQFVVGQANRQLFPDGFWYWVYPNLPPVRTP